MDNCTVIHDPARLVAHELAHETNRVTIDKGIHRVLKWLFTIEGVGGV